MNFFKKSGLASVVQAKVQEFKMNDEVFALTSSPVWEPSLFLGVFAVYFTDAQFDRFVSLLIISSFGSYCSRLPTPIHNYALLETF
jgi:hypothetical protein